MTTHKFQAVNFTLKQVQELEKLFPTLVLPASATEAEMRTYFGQQSVMGVIRDRVQRDTH
jgi:hypothetical protein